MLNSKSSLLPSKSLFCIVVIIIAFLIAIIGINSPYIISRDIEWVSPFEYIETIEYNLGDGFTATETTTSATTITSVRHKDEDHFSPEQWNEILVGIQNGSIVWED